MNTTIPNYYLAISSASYDFYAFTETWLSTTTLSSQIFGTEYEVFRCDRSAANSCKDSEVSFLPSAPVSSHAN